MKYTATLVVEFESTLTVSKLNERLVVALLDTNTEITTIDGESEELVVLDYKFTEATKIK